MGLIHWWSFNNTVDDNGNRPKAMIPENSPTFQAGGKTASYSARYSGGSDHYIDNDIQNCDELSMACWVKLDTSQSTWGQLFSINTWTTDWQGIMMGFDNRPNVAVYFTITDGTNYVGYDMPSNSNLQDGQWHHLAGTYKWDGSKSTLRFYVDGVEQSCSPHTVTYKPAFSSARYISTGEDAGEYINGNINDARIYDHCLSEFEVKNLSKALVLHYNFEELYKELEYIETTGSQYIKTGVVGPAIWEYDIQYTNTTARQLMGHGGSGGEYWGTTDGVYGMAAWSKGSIAVGNRDIFKVENLSSGRKIYVNGVYSHSEGYDTRCEQVEAQLFAIGGGYLNYCRLWKCKVWQNNVLIRDFIPVLRQYDGKAGLYDKVNGTFYTNAGTGEFSYNDCFPAVNYQNASISGNTITFSKSSDGWGNSGILAKTPVNKGFVSATVAQNNRYIMIGFAPVNNSYNYTQGYFIYPSNNAHYHIYELGAHIGDFGTYNANDVFRVVYDGSKISYYKNDSLVREISTSGKMYMNITNYNAASATIKDVSYGSLEFIKDNSGNGHFARLATPTAFSQSTDSKIGEYSLRNISGDSNARINTTLNPSFITNGTIAFWYKKDSSAFNYNSGNFLVATQLTSGSWIGASDGAGLPFNSGSSYQNFYIDGVQRTSGSSNIQDTNWHFYVFTGVNLSAWTSFSMHAHGDASWLYRGNLADFKIYNSSLSYEDIKSLYEARMIIDPKGNIYCEKLIDNESSCEFPSKQGTIKAVDFFKSNSATINVEYEKLNYIESHGAQYINTGFIANQDTKINVVYTPEITTTSTEFVFGSRTVFNIDGISYCPNHNGKNFIQYDDVYTALGDSYAKSKLTEVTIDKNNFYFNGKFVYSFAYAAFTTPHPMLLFACYSSNQGGLLGCSNIKLYSCKIYDNGIKVRDFIPVKRKSDNTIGLFDKINGTFYTNSGSGSFTAGISLGTCYLVGAKNLYEDMGVSVNPNTTNK